MLIVSRTTKYATKATMYHLKLWEEKPKRDPSLAALCQGGRVTGS